MRRSGGRCVSSAGVGAVAFGVICLRLSHAAGRAAARQRRIPTTTAFMELREREAAAGRRERACIAGCRIRESRSTCSGPCSPPRTAPSSITRASTSRRFRSRSRTASSAGSGAARRQHDHAAAGEESVSVAVARSAAQGQGADDHVAARSGAVQGAHLRDLSERDRVGRSRVGRRSGGSHLLRRAGLGAVAPQAALLAGAIINPRLYSPARPTRPAAAPPADHPRAHGKHGPAGASCHRPSQSGNGR